MTSGGIGKESSIYQKDGKKAQITMTNTLIIKLIQFFIQVKAYFDEQTAVLNANTY